MHIARHFIDDLLSRTDLVEVIGSYLSLRKAGHNFIAKCPFHNEKTPSFSVSSEKQFYYCFGCGAHGNAISFLMQYANLDFVEAVQELAFKIGVSVVYDSSAEISPPVTAETEYQLLTEVAHYFRQQLRYSQPAINYLKSRGLTGEIARDFALGYAPVEWDNVLKAFGSNALKINQLMSVGLINKHEHGHYYDRFRNRIIFPIWNQRGQIIAFGGRLLHNDSNAPKYLNSPETFLFQKGRELYGWHLACQVRPLQQIVVVEGYMDVIALVQHGINNVVATLGTAITREHLARLFRKVSQIIFCFDGDAAGQKAAWRALEMALPLLKEGRQVHFVFLPLKTDPDTFVRHQGVQAFQHLLAQAIPISDFLFNRLKQRVNFTLNNPEIQATLVEQAKPLLMQLTNGSYRELMLQKLAELTHLPHAKLSQLLYAKTEATPTQIKEVRRKSIREYSLIHQAIIYLLHQPRLVQFVELPKLSWLQQQHPEGKILLTLIEFMKTHPQLKLGTILEHWRGTEYEPIFEQLAAQEMSLETIEDDVFKDVMKGLGQQYVNQRLAELDSKITQLTDEERQEYELLRNTKSSNPSLVGWIPGIQ